MTSIAPSTAVAEILDQANRALDNYDSRRALELLAPFESTENGIDYLACLIEAQCMVRDFERAEATIARALSLLPANARILHAAGINSFHERKYELAEERFKSAIEADATYAKAYNNMGMNYEFMNREEPARAAYLHAIRHDPGLAVAYKNLGRLAESSGRLDEARGYFEQGRLATSVPDEFVALLENLGHNFKPGLDEKSIIAETTETLLATEIGRAVERHLKGGTKPAVIDLICGDGIVGKLLWGRTGLITGVDPRIHLLQQAQAAGVYYDLKDQTPAVFLRTCKRGETDLVTANCAFIDQGDLLPFFLNVYAVLARGGLLVTTFPTRQDALGYTVESRNLFSHDPRYVAERADFEGMQLLERIDYAPETHPGIDHTYTLMVFAKPA